MELYEMTAASISRLIKEKKVSAAETAEYFAKRIRNSDSKIRSYITVCDRKAQEMAERADLAVAKGNVGVLCGVPVSVKDNICTAKIRTTCASNMLKEYIPTYNATVVELLIRSGMPILGKNNLDEFAMGSFGDNSAFFQTLNPLGQQYVPGGSSSGSASSVAAGFAAASLGTDTGGSVRTPAAFCGLCGFKPSYGAISRYGLIAYASSLDTMGLITKTIEDLILFSSVLFGRDPLDMTSVKVPVPCNEDVDFSDICFAFSDKDIECAEPEISDAVYRIADILSANGARRKDVTVFGNSKMDDAYRIIACAEATSNLARYDGIKYGGEKGNTVEDTREKLFGSEVKRRIEYGNFVLSEENFDKYYKEAVQERERVIKRIDMLFEEADIILSPLCDFLVPTYEESQNCRADRFTVAANFAGVPAVSFPVAKDRRGLPISIQLMSKKYSDAFLLNVAAKLEKLLYGEACL